jgi:hypothetical protein
MPPKVDFQYRFERNANKLYSNRRVLRNSFLLRLMLKKQVKHYQKLNLINSFGYTRGQRCGVCTLYTSRM